MSDSGVVYIGVGLSLSRNLCTRECYDPELRPECIRTRISRMKDMQHSEQCCWIWHVACITGTIHLRGLDLPAMSEILENMMV
jgi:hypothetical protein